MKKLLKFMLVLSLLVPTYVFVSYVSDESSIMAKTMGDYTYDVASDDTITIVNYNGSENEVIIPNEIDGKKVKKIGYAAFAECKSIESLTIPTSVTIIDSYAFSQCSQLKEIHIPDSVVSLGKYAFGACISLEEVILPNKIKGLGYGTFFDCIALKNVVFPEGLKSIGESTFGNCKSLVEINFPASLTSIEGNAFTYCISLQTLNLPEGLNFIGSGVFSGCLALEQVNLPESLSGIGQSAFQDCVSLERIAIPNTVSGIGYSAFSGCTNLKEINIPSALSSLGNAVFSGCSSLESMVIPSTITEIGNNVFSGCTNLKEVIIPDSVTSIGDEAFSYCSSLTSMTLPKNIETIPTSLFRYCSSLESIVIPTGVKEIKSTAFADCSNLISVTIPSSTSIFGSRVFSNSPLAVVSVASESAAYKYAVNNKIKYRIFSTGINLDKTQLQLKIGQNSTFAVIMSPYTIIDNKQVTWTSSNANVATVDAQGVVIGVNIGEAIITAQSANGQKASATVAVDDNEVAIEQITLSKTQMTMKKGTSEGLKATIDPTNTTTDKTLGWQSSNDQVVSVSSTGSLTARAPGEATITVTTTNGKQVSCQVTVISEIKSISLNQTSLVVEEGTKHSLRASINPIDTTDSKEITWVSSNPNVATVDAHGMVTTVAEGTVTISAISVNNKRAECKIRVLNAEIAVPITSVTLNKTSLTLTEGDKETIEATINPANTTDDKTLTWTTSDAKIATVKEGEVVAVKEGKTTITVRTSNGKTSTCVVDVERKPVPIEKIELNKKTLELKLGNSETLIATITPNDTTESKVLSWTSNKESVASVNEGVITTHSAGEATIKVTTEDGLSATCTVLVYEVNKTTLLATIQKVEVMDSSQYTQRSWDKVLIATNEAKSIYEDEDVKQKEIDAAVNKVNTAIAQLVVRASDSAIEMLRALVEECKGFADQFTEAEFASMQQTIVETEALLAKQPTEISQEEVDDAKVLLANEKQKLIVIDSQNTLKEAIAAANEILAGDITGISEKVIVEMRKEVANGEALIASNSSDIDTMNTVTKNLQELIGLAQHVVDKSMLNDLVELGKGFAGSLYTVDSWEKFESQLMLAQSMLEATKVTQSEVNDQYENLADALLRLKVKVDVSILTGDIEDIQMILDHANKYIASSIKGLNVLVEEAKILLEKENVTSEEVKDMNKRLMKAKLQARLKGN